LQLIQDNITTFTATFTATFTHFIFILDVKMLNVTNKQINKTHGLSCLWKLSISVILIVPSGSMKALSANLVPRI
jgi:hypothetical protein